MVRQRVGRDVAKAQRNVAGRNHPPRGRGDRCQDARGADHDALFHGTSPV
jgi:hypothetical protein